jgi:F0F1-type ATP synthase delta subunit
MAHEQALVLPMLVASPVDVGRLQRELTSIDEALVQLGLRKSGSEVKMPKTSQLMDQLIGENKLNLLLEEDRKQLANFLEQVKAKAPVLHMSFSADPSASFIERLMAWLRQEINPYVLVSVGLQPNIGAGCVVRSTNRQFDFSLRQDFLNKRDLLMSKIIAGQPEAKA